MVTPIKWDGPNTPVQYIWCRGGWWGSTPEIIKEQLLNFFNIYIATWEWMAKWAVVRNAQLAGRLFSELLMFAVMPQWQWQDPHLWMTERHNGSGHV
jgi:hypothetical protein